MGTKSCTKILIFRQDFKIFAVEDFNINDGEMLFGHDFDKLVYAGEIQNSNCRRLEMATYFFLTRG